MFGDSTTVSWFVDGKDITGHFYNDNEYISVLYKKNGRHAFTRKVYDSTRLDQRLVTYLEEEAGKEFSVNLVTEIVKEEGTVYEISLTSHKQICLIQIFAGKGDEKLRLIDKKFLTKG